MLYVFPQHHQEEQTCGKRVVSDDTDVFIILLSVVATSVKGNLYFRQGCNNVGKGIEFHDMYALANYLGDHCYTNLLAFHATLKLSR